PASLSEIERQAARAMVDLHGDNKSAAAAALDISRSRLYRLLGESEADAARDALDLPHAEGR
ncbi:MAG TPA: hypothetical protein VMN39_09175, partial [Longimicrobiaceae bacterium]|nr:hypothetical protein [Longimicrobiaceae bacterium]